MVRSMSDAKNDSTRHKKGEQQYRATKSTKPSHYMGTSSKILIIPIKRLQLTFHKDTKHYAEFEIWPYNLMH